MADEENQRVMIMGRDITKIPCMRQSILYSIGTSFGAGLLGFLFTSRPRLASHIAVGTYCTSMFLIFTVCRIQVMVNTYQRDVMQDALQAYMVMESTENGPVRKADPVLDDV